MGYDDETCADCGNPMTPVMIGMAPDGRMMVTVGPITPDQLDEVFDVFSDPAFRAGVHAQVTAALVARKAQEN